MGTFLLILLCIFFWFILWVRYQWRHNPGKLLRMIFGFPSQKNNRGGKRSRKDGERVRGRKWAERRRESVIPKEYAEDVEFVEIKEFTSVKEAYGPEKGKTIVTESQVSDAEWVEIKEKK